MSNEVAITSLDPKAAFDSTDNLIGTDSSGITKKVPYSTVQADMQGRVNTLGASLQPQIDVLADAKDTVAALIPQTATANNKLVDKAYVDDSIQTATATFRGNFATKADLDAYSGSADINDYAVVMADETHSDQAWRYKYDGASWAAEYKVNDTALTQSQAASLNSGITSTHVNKLNNIEAGAEVNVQADWNQTDTTADDYIKNKPAGVTVDQSLDATSMDAVANKPVTEAITVTNNLIKGYICDTLGDAPVKVIEIPGFELVAGAIVKVMFTYKNVSASPQLKVTSGGVSTGQKYIKVIKGGTKVNLVGHNGYWLDAATKTFEVWQAGTILELMYDGTDWVIVGNPVLESWNWTDGPAGYRVYADGLIELWDRYYTGITFETVTYDNTNYTNAVQFKIEFKATPSFAATCEGTSNNEMSYSEWIYACCPIAYRRHRGHSYDFNSSWIARGY